MSVMEADGPAVLDEIVILAMTSGAPTVAERPLRWRLHDAKDGRLACLAALTVPERQPGLRDTGCGPPAITRNVPRVGSTAQLPGNKRL